MKDRIFSFYKLMRTTEHTSFVCQLATYGVRFAKQSNDQTIKKGKNVAVSPSLIS